MSPDLHEKISQWLEKDFRMTFMERVHLLLESEPLFKDEPYAVRYGHTLAYTLERISVPIQNGENIVGSVKEEIPEPEIKQKYDEIFAEWWNKPEEDIHKEAVFYYSKGWIKCRPPWFQSMGHLGYVWEEIIDGGLGSLRDKALHSLENYKSIESKRVFLEGILLCYDAISGYIRRYGEEAKRLGMNEKAKSLAHLAENAPRTFEEALQLLWLLALVSQKVCGCGVLNYSRMDQYLLPLYEKDVEEGRLDAESATGLLCEFFFKNNEFMAPVDHMSQETAEVQYTLEVAYDDPNYLTVGGLLPDGSSGVNELSHLMVEATHRLRLRNPFMVVRYHDGIDDGFWRGVCSAMRDNATVVLYNDETMIPALTHYGVDKEDVYDYGFFGCNDPDISGKEGGLRQLWFNLAKPLELALHRGDFPIQPRAGTQEKECQFPIQDRMTGLMVGAYYGIDTGPLEEMRSINDFIDAFYQQMLYLMREYRKGFEWDVREEQTCNLGRLRIEDCFLDGTVEKAENWILGGTKYHKIVAQGTGLATVADSLYAISRLVFEEKVMTLPELAVLLAADYKGNEQLAEVLKKKYPKFGNDIDEVDRYAKIAASLYVKAVDQVNGSEYLYQLWPTLSSDRDFTTMGGYVGATPDGRRCGEQLSENQSPAEGADREGITALLNSVSKIDFNRLTGGPLNVRIHPGSVSGREGLDVLCALLRTYMQNGGMQIQINVVDAEELRRAKREPEKYKNLCVRVTGYSAFFTQMGEKAQNELIHRTEQMV